MDSIQEFKNQIISALNIDEIRDLCFDLDINFDTLTEGNIKTRVISLLYIVKGRNLFEQLLSFLNKEFSTLSWPTSQELKSFKWSSSTNSLRDSQELLTPSANINRVGDNNIIAQGSNNRSLGAGAINVENNLSPVNISVTTPFPTDLIDAKSQLNTLHKNLIDSIKPLLNSFKLNQAKQRIDLLKEQIWDEAENYEKYRILSYEGFVLLYQNNNKSAGIKLIEAFGFYSDDLIASCNGALAHFLLGNLKDCQNLVKQILEKDHTNERAYSLLIRSSPDDQPFSSLLELVPEYYRSKPEITLALSDAAYKQSLILEADNFLRNAITNNKNPHMELLARLASSLLSQEIAKNPLIHPVNFELVQESAKLYGQAWGLVKDSDLRQYKVDWLVNKAMANTILGDYSSALNDAKEAINENISSPETLKNLAITAYDCNELSMAELLLRKLVTKAPSPENKLWLSSVLFYLGNTDESEVFLSDCLSDLEAPHLQHRASTLFVELALSTNNLSQANDFLNQRLRPNGDEPHLLALKARVKRFEGNKGEFIASLKLAQQFIGESSNLETRIILGIEFFNAHMYEDAYQLFQVIVTQQLHPQILTPYLKCCFKIEKWQEALEICQKLREAENYSSYVAETEIIIHEQMGDLQTALDLSKLYLEIEPRNTSILLRKATFDLRLENWGELDKFLDSKPALAQFPLIAYLQLSELNFKRNRKLKGLEIAFDALRIFPVRPDAHTHFVSYFYSSFSEEERKEFFRAEIVEEDTVVFLSGIEHQHDPIYKIINHRYQDQQQYEIFADDPLAKKLLGLTVEEEIEVGNGPFIKKYRIEKILSKYVHEVHNSMNSFETSFPDTFGLVAIPIALTLDESIDSESFQPLLQLVDQHHSKVDEAFNLYKSGQCTIGTLQSILHCSAIEIFIDLTNLSNGKINCFSQGNHILSQATSLIDDTPKGIIIDITSLITVHNLGIQEHILRSFSKIVIARSSYEMLKKHLEKLNLTKGEKVSIGKQNGQYIRQVVSPEESERLIDFFQRIKDWAEKHCHIAMPDINSKLNMERFDEINKLLGTAFLDTALIARDENLILYSEDELFRKLAQIDFHVRGIWSQPLLIALKKQGSIHDEFYQKSIIALICQNFSRISITHDTLLEAAKSAKWDLAFPLTNVLSILNESNTDWKSATLVSVEFINQFWRQEKPLPSQLEKLFNGILDAMTLNRNADGITKILDLMQSQILTMFGLAPTVEESLQSLIKRRKLLHLL